MRSWYAYYLLLHATRKNASIREASQEVLSYLLHLSGNEIPCRESDLSRFMSSIVDRDRKFTQYELFLIMKRESWCPKWNKTTAWRIREYLGRHGRLGSGKKERHTGGRPTRKKLEQEPNV